MSRNIVQLFFLSAVVILLAACNEGLRPDDSVVNAPKPVHDSTVKYTGIAGTVTFRGTRPAADSLLQLNIVVLTKKYPINFDTLFPLFGKSLFLGDTLSRFVDSTKYLDTLPVQQYGYIVVAQQYSTAGSLFGSWRAVGVYAPSGNDSVPGTVTMIKDSIIGGINIIVDYDHLPPQ